MEGWEVIRGINGHGKNTVRKEIEDKKFAVDPLNWEVILTDPKGDLGLELVGQGSDLWQVYAKTS